MARHSIVLDCDPGQDDAIAILLALASPDEIELLGLTTVAGNVPLGLTRVNARKMLEVANRSDVPVWAGCDRPLIRTLETAEYVHGESGLNGAVLPEPTMPLQDGHAVDAIIDMIMARPARTVTICAVGPLTNIALALRKEPHLVQRVKEIVLMGGAVELGNVTPAAEFNIYVDPHAADIVFRSGIPIVMFGLDVTHQVLVTQQRLERIGAIGTDVAAAAHGLLDFFNRFDMERYDAPGAPLHDPCVIAYLIDPSIFKGKACPVDIELEGKSVGRTLVDWWNSDRRVPNATVMREVDADRFFDLLTDRLSQL